MSKGCNFKSGEWNAICDSCGFKYKSGQMRKRWDGFMVCPDCFEIRHPQDFLRTKPDRQDLPWSRPRPVDVFIENLTLFENEFVTILDSLEFTATYNRDFTDLITVADNLIFNINKNITDTVTIGDAVNLQLSGSVYLNDSVSLSNTGSLIKLDYVDTTYFAEYYVGQETQFLD